MWAVVKGHNLLHWLRLSTFDVTGDGCCMLNSGLCHVLNVTGEVMDDTPASKLVDTLFLYLPTVICLLEFLSAPRRCLI